jgi:predicted RNA-binding Zn-ribbon protein involved in translation (DUF1610 family)
MAMPDLCTEDHKVEVASLPFADLAEYVRWKLMMKQRFCIGCLKDLNYAAYPITYISEYWVAPAQIAISLDFVAFLCSSCYDEREWEGCQDCRLLYPVKRSEKDSENCPRCGAPPISRWVKNRSLSQLVLNSSPRNDDQMQENAFEVTK